MSVGGLGRDGGRAGVLGVWSRSFMAVVRFYMVRLLLVWSVSR